MKHKCVLFTPARDFFHSIWKGELIYTTGPHFILVPFARTYIWSEDHIWKWDCD